MRKSVWFVLLLLPWMAAADAHELQDNRITIVLHEQHGVSVILRLDYAGLLQHLMAPTANPQDFLLALAAQPASVLEVPLTALQTQVQQGLVLRHGGVTLKLARWRWPSAAVLHAALRERLMGAMVSGGSAASEQLPEVTAETADSAAITRLTIDVPELIRPAVIVWSSPRQLLIGPRDATRTLEF